MTTEQITTAILAIGFVASVIRWLISAWQKALKDQTSSPASTSTIIDASIDVVDILRKQLSSMSIELDKLQQEVANVRNLLAAVETQRDEWKARSIEWQKRAVDLGWIDVQPSPRD